MKSLKNCKMLSILFIIVFLSGTTGHAVLIDSFDDGFQYLSSSVVSTQSDSVVDYGGGIIGDEREITLDVIQAGAWPNVASLGADIGDELSWSNDSNFQSTASVLWNGTSTVTMSVDLTDAGTADSIEMDITNIDTTVTLKLSLTDTYGQTATLEISSLTTGIIMFQFASFNNILFTDLSQTVSIELFLTAGVNSDVSLDYIRTGAIPEPSTILLFLIGLFGMGVVRKKFFFKK